MILLVDDFAPSLHLHSRMLRDQGFAVRQANSAEAAFKLAAECRPKLVLLDVHLPDQNGFAVCRRLRESYPDLPVVMTSATYTDETSRISALYAGAAEFLAEPISPGALAKVVKRYLPSSGKRTPV
jgi:DNA-binding response OmpR family regulator